MMHRAPRRVAITFGLLIAAVAPAAAQEGAGDPDPAFDVLVFSKTAGFRHRSIPDGVRAMHELGKRGGFRVTATEDAAVFDDEGLEPFEVVVFLSTTGDVLNDEQQAAFQRFVRGGGGYVGIHAASDTEYDWPWYGRLVGAYFKSHPRVQDAVILVHDRAHPSTKMLEERWTRNDEWYDYRDNPRGRVHVLMTLDESSYENGRMGHDHPIAWCHEFDGGRSWYTGGGHTSASFAEPKFLAHVLGGIRWAARVEDGDAGATIDSHYDKTVLDDFVTDPMELAVAPDGRVVFVERGGVIKVWRPDSRTTAIAGIIDVFDELEDGLLGVALDPAFPANGHLYLYYSPAGDAPKNVLSRFTLVGDEIEPGSEVVMLEVATQRDECCHSGGSITFDGRGNLLLSTGDNTSPFASSGFTPIDERGGRAPFDAQKSSASTHDLRGKILRIRPRADGSYDIPDGNLFATEAEGRREIYAMGCRNPFRIAVDPEDGTLYWGDVGPDASTGRDDRGPAGLDEFNRTRTAGNFGWPYFIGDNTPYVDYDFATQISGGPFDPSVPVNDSPNRSGRRGLPPARPAWIWYPYSVSEEFPDLGEGGRCAMAGPVYHFDPDGASDRRLPAYFDDVVFVYEWARDWLGIVRLDESGEILDIHDFLPGFVFRRPMDMELGPDGRLYLIEWGAGFGGGNPDAQVVRIDHFPTGHRPPAARAAADVTSGPAPLTVRFTSEGSGPRGAAREVTTSWDFDGDGVIDSREADPVHVFRARGRHTAQLTVRDGSGLTTVANVAITVGNTAPAVSFDWPPHGGVAPFGDAVVYRAAVDDPEDALFETSRVAVQTYLGHDTHAHPLTRATGFDGVIRTRRDEGHPEEADLFTVLAATYTDLGAPRAERESSDPSPAEVPVLTGRAEVILQPRRKQAEHATALEGPRLEKASDRDGGGQALVLEGDGQWASYEPINLHAIEALTLRVAAGAAGGTLELRLDGPGGPLIGRAVVEPSGGRVLAAGPHAIRVEYFERGGGAGVILRASGPGVAKSVVDGAMLTHGTDHAPGLEARYYALDDPTELPDFSVLEPYATEVVERIDFPSTPGAFAGSGRSDHLGVVFAGWITLPEAGPWSFALESDDGSRLLVDDELIVDNGGLHGMTEKSAALRWLDVRVPVTDPGGTHALHLVARGLDGETAMMKVNWIEFEGPGVTTDPSESSPAPPTSHDHSR
jgi:glucose/arabinose dehydrogenase